MALTGKCNNTAYLSRACDYCLLLYEEREEFRTVCVVFCVAVL